MGLSLAVGQVAVHVQLYVAVDCDCHHQSITKKKLPSTLHEHVVWITQIIYTDCVSLKVVV